VTEEYECCCYPKAVHRHEHVHINDHGFSIKLLNLTHPNSHTTAVFPSVVVVVAVVVLALMEVDGFSNPGKRGAKHTSEIVKL
jgi:hypothetical protein